MPTTVDTERALQEQADGMRVTWAGMAVNLVLVGLKLYGGLVGKSQALVADAVHSLSDLFSDIIVLLGLKWGRKEADDDHPYGHGRIETIASAFVGIFLLIAGIGIAYEAIESVYERQVSQPRTIALVMAGLSIIAKEWMYWYTVRVGRRIRSAVLIGNAWHHRSDALSSVAVFVGLLVTMINPDWYLADAIAALLVALFILRVGGQLIWQAFRELADTAPEQRILNELQRRAEKVNGVLQVHDLKGRHMGAQLIVEMHVVVDGAMTVFDGHEIAREVRLRLLEDVEEVSEVFVHLDPDTEMH